MSGNRKELEARDMAERGVARLQARNRKLVLEIAALEARNRSLVEALQWIERETHGEDGNRWERINARAALALAESSDQSPDREKEKPT